MSKIKDLIEVPPVKTVIQLKDADDARLRDLLARNFLITDEVALFFKSFWSALLEKEGRGFFVEGNFGSGKSHLLGVLSLLLNYPQAWPPLLEQNTGLDDILEKTRKQLSSGRYMVIKTSLVEHSSREYLEDIVLRALEKTWKEEGLSGSISHQTEDFINYLARTLQETEPQKLKSILREKEMTEEELFDPDNFSHLEEVLERLNLPYRLKYDRREVFSRLNTALREQGFAGVVFLIDELSEFLRSKADSRRFNEDIRFLQFLGELTYSEPVWVVATLQEEIEKTGETTPEAFNKIKDRYPFRFRLTGSHIRDLIGQRLIQPKPGAREKIEEIFDFYQGSFVNWKVDREDFLRLYPVHPLTIDLLDNLKPLFSQHRGIIDFIHFQLKGDERRHIEGHLHRDCYDLLTPDLIFDHFQERIREMIETNPYLEKVFRYYEQEIESILPAEDQATGLALIKLLILFRISPLEKRYTVEDMANMLLHQITDLDPAVNYQNVAEILEKMHQNGAYIGRESGSSPREEIFFIDLEADTNLLLQRRVEYVKNTIFPDDHRLFTRLGLLVKNRNLPLGEILENPWTLRDFTWQNTSRRGYLLLESFQELTPQKIQELEAYLREREEDFLIVVGPARNCEQERRILFNDVLPRLSDTEGDSFAFWSPQEVGDPEFLREVLARLIMYEEYREDSGSRAGNIREAIKTQLEEDREKINSLFTRAYLEGKIYGRNGAELLDLEDIGLLPWENILEKIVFRILDRRFPEHLNIAPFQSHFNSSQLRVLEDKLFKSGEMEIDMAHSTGMIRLIDGYLQPMGLIKKKQRKIQVEIQPDKNPLIRALFQSLSREKTEIKSLYWQMRKGPLGLTYHQFSILVLALLYSGYLSAYTEQRKISLKNFNSSQLPGVKYIGYGEIIREDCQEILQNCQLIPPRFRNQPFSLPLQQSIWEYLTDLKEEKAPQLENLAYKIGELEKKDMIQPFSRDDLLRHLHQVQNLLEEIKVSYSAEEGLERFATAYRNLPHIEKNLDRADKIADFFDKKFDQYLALRRYLSHPGLQIPPGEKYREIRGLEQGLQESLQDEALIFDPSFFTATWETFRRFKDEYSALYSREHQKELGEERFRPYLDKKESSAYRVLNLLSRIELISVKNDLVKVDRLLNRALAQRCRVFAPENLEQVPVCSCGFALGTRLELPSLQEIQKIMEHGVDEYLEALQAEENAGKISNYIQNMEEAGEKKKARPLQAILQLSLEEQSRLKELDKKLNQEVIDRINKALAGDYSVIQRNLDELYENIVDRSFTPQQLQKIFTEWLEGSEKLPRNTYVQVQGGDSDPPDRDETGIDRFLEQNFPELKPYREELGDSFFLVLAAQQWEEKHGIKVLDLWPEELLQEEHPPTINALQELGNSILKQQQLRGEFTTIIDGILREKSLVESLLNRMELNSIKKIARALVNEELSPLLQEEILIRMIKMAGQETNLGPARQLLEKAEEETDFKREPVELGRSYLELQEGLEALSRRVESPRLRDWVQLMQGPAGQLELNYFRLQKKIRPKNRSSRIPLDLKGRHIQQELGAASSDFKNFFRNLNPQLLKESPQITDITSLVLEYYPRLCTRVKSDHSYLILLDGLRLDLAREIWKELQKHLTLRPIEEGVLIAREPTNTETQLLALEKEGFSGRIISAPDFYPGQAGPEDVVKFDYIDQLIHTEKKDYAELVENLIFQTRKNLVPFLQELPPYALLLFFSDHGFAINHKFRPENKYREERYRHGEVSLPEVIVPWNCFYRV